MLKFIDFLLTGGQMKNFIIILFIFITLNLFAVHNFTINEQEFAEITLGDTINLYFEYEEVGATANIEIQISLGQFPMPPFSNEQFILEDGGAFDQTDVDGIFVGTLPVFASAPSSASVELILTDNDVSDSVQLTFIPLDSDFSLSGTVTQEGDWVDLPVPGTLVYTLYNADLSGITDLLDIESIDELFTYFSQSHYLVSEVTSIMGGYQLFIPDEIENVTCVTGVYGILDTQNTHVNPGMREDIINSHVSNIDFFYNFADGILTATILDQDGYPVENALVSIFLENETIPQVFTTDETGIITAALANGNYSINVTTTQYQIYSDEFEINDSDVDLTINLVPLLDIYEDEIEAETNMVSYPNPLYGSNNVVNISYQLPNSKDGKIKIFNAKGQCVTTIKIDSNNPNGKAAWNVKNSGNKKITSGVYYLQLISNNSVVSSNKIVILK